MSVFSNKELYDLGGKLAGVKYVAGCKNKPAGVPCVLVEDTYYAACSGPEELKVLNSRPVYVLNSWSIEDYLLPGAVQLFTGNYTARQGHGYKEFDALAFEAMGADQVGILRMDVDNLGTVFTRGLPEGERTFSRLSTLSRSLTHFFKYHVNEICRGIGTSATTTVITLW